MNHVLQPDTQAILLLCASFGQNRQIEPQPLTLSEYNSLVNWLMEHQMRPGDLLSVKGKSKLQTIPVKLLDANRISALLERGMMLSLAVEKWTNQGLWVIGRSDTQYPKCLKQILKHSAPAILYGIGNIELLSQGGLAIVGSRDVDEEGIDYTQRIARTCAEQEIQVVSGGARGVDSVAMLGVLEAGGTAVGVLADSLAKAAVTGKYRAAIKENRLTLVSPYDPNAGFNVGNAMGRNKYIYALANWVLVISSSLDKGGTWAGVIEALKRIKDVPVFVRIEPNVPEGNRQLLHKGGIPFLPGSSVRGKLRELLEVAREEIVIKSEVETTLSKVETAISELVDIGIDEKSGNLSSKDKDKDIPAIPFHPKDIYEAVLPFILRCLEQPLDEKSLAEYLDVQLGQMRIWLKKAVEEGKVKKTKNPVAYVINQKGNLLFSMDDSW
ncbi:SMF family protein [Oscillatoriales cyanobacterium USR001]|nr:SMF family protein [Oscillatoriales cyanobacterium USR001]